MNLEFLRGKKIALLGIGLEGRSNLNFLVSQGIIPVALLDAKSEIPNDAAASIQEHEIKFIGGENYLDNLSDYDILFRSPGVSRLHPKLISFPDQSAILSQTKLFFHLCPCPIIGITGTKGKGTVSSIIYEILKAAGKDVYLGGNIGSPPLDFLNKLTPASTVVFELSSFQLQDLDISPHVAVVLNITQDHLDQHASLDEYVEAKKSVLKYQKPEDFAVISELLPVEFQKLGQGKKIIFKRKDGEIYNTLLLGAHNKYNIAAASRVAQLLNIEEAVIAATISNFKGLPHRLQIVGEKDSITYVDDSISTNSETAIAAIDSFPGPKVLIVGGSDKGLDYAQLGQKILSAQNIKGLVVVGEVAPKILDSIKEFKGKVLTGGKNMREIVYQAKSLASAGDTVLLSPAAASFDMFKNYKDRGDQFINAAFE